MIKHRIILSILLILAWLQPAMSQSGTARTRSPGVQPYGVNLTYVCYQFDASKSSAMDEVTRLIQTFSSAHEELNHIKDKYKLEGMEIRHTRAVGLANSEPFNDAVLLGPEYMVFSVTPHDIAHGHMKLDFRAKYANQTLLDVKDVEFDNFETVAIRGGQGMFGLRYFIGEGGRTDSVAVERTILMSITPEIVPVSNLRDRPEQISQPVTETGSPIRLAAGDRFIPPVPLERVVPKFEAGRAINGSVILSGIVTPEGKMTNVKVIRSIDPAIDDRAIEAYRQYVFSPALLNGKPAFATYREVLTFASPLPTLLEMQEEQRKQREKQKGEDKRKKKKFED